MAEATWEEIAAHAEGGPSSHCGQVQSGDGEEVAFSSDPSSAGTRSGAAYWAREFRPYLRAAAGQFSPAHRSLTERLLQRKARTVPPRG
jgi:hypothetical protein